MNQKDIFYNTSCTTRLYDIITFYLFRLLNFWSILEFGDKGRGFNARPPFCVLQFFHAALIDRCPLRSPPTENRSRLSFARLPFVSGVHWLQLVVKHDK